LATPEIWDGREAFSQNVPEGGRLNTAARSADQNTKLSVGVAEGIKREMEAGDLWSTSPVGGTVHSQEGLFAASVAISP
jgi:hypothetical protein